MNINPTLILNFTATPSSGVAVQSISTSYIVRDSIVIQYQLLSGLKSASNLVSLSLASDCPAIADIISSESDIKATLKNGSETLFTGYVSTNYSWGVGHTGEAVFKLSLEDNTTRLLSKPFISSGYHLFNCTLASAVSAICTKAGIVCNTFTSNIQVIKAVDSSATCRDILTQLCYEAGYAYYCDNEGKLKLYEINCSSTSGLAVVDSSNLIARRGNSAVTLSKKARQYKSAKVKYSEVAEASSYLVYRNTTGQGNGHPYCFMEMPAGSYFDGLEVYTASEWAEATADTFREPALVEACNASSESAIVGSNNIISADSLTYTVTPQSSISFSVTPYGKHLKIVAHNSSNITVNVSRMDVSGHIIYEKNQSIIRTSTEAVASGASESVIEEELSYIHSTDLAQKHANLLSQYYKYCGQSYSFSSDLDISVGAIVNLKDTLHSGLNVNVLVYGKTVTDSNQYYTYTACGISVFNLTKDVYRQSTSNGNKDSAGQSAYQIAVSNGYTGTEEEWLASLKAKDIIVQYAYGESALEPPESGWYSRAEASQVYSDYIITLEGSEVTLDDAEIIFPSEIDGKYLWERQSTDGGVTWLYIRMTGKEGHSPVSLGFVTSDPENAETGDYMVWGGTTSASRIYGQCYEYDGEAWKTCTNADKLIGALDTLRQEGVNLGDISDSNTVSWFTSIVSDSVVAEKVRANSAFFNDITAENGTYTSIKVNGESFLEDTVTMKGAIISNAMDTHLTEVSQATITLSTGTVFAYSCSDLATKYASAGGKKVVRTTSGSSISYITVKTYSFHNDYYDLNTKKYIGNESENTKLSESDKHYDSSFCILEDNAEEAGADKYYKLDIAVSGSSAGSINDVSNATSSAVINSLSKAPVASMAWSHKTFITIDGDTYTQGEYVKNASGTISTGTSESKLGAYIANVMPKTKNQGQIGSANNAWGSLYVSDIYQGGVKLFNPLQGHNYNSDYITPSAIYLIKKYSIAWYMWLPNRYVIQWGTFLPKATRCNFYIPIRMADIFYSFTMSSRAGSNMQDDSEGFDMVDGINQKYPAYLNLSIADTERAVEWFCIGKADSNYYGNTITPVTDGSMFS